MHRTRLRHMVVVLPGITGSILQKDGRDLWAFSGSAIWNSLAHPRRMLDDLEIHGVDDYKLDDLGDGVTAVGLVQNATIIPGFVKLVTGYNDLVDAIRQNFDIVGHGSQTTEPSNLFEFPYDWRRDNRASARRLQRLIENRLYLWREYTMDPAAKVILIAHSMGGLVSRYYLEVLEGWRDCLALVSLGTPYRGSLNALRFLTEGYKEATLDLTNCLRSYNSVYQLLPTYSVVRDGGTYCRVTDFESPQIDRSRAETAKAFHQLIADRVREHSNDPEYLRDGYKVVPFVGTHQPTIQSAELGGGKLHFSPELPPEVYETLEAGDGTVPRFSASPPDLDDEYRQSFVAQKHGSLQASGIILPDLINRLEQMQVPRTKPVRGRGLLVGQAAIVLYNDDVYSVGDSPGLQVYVEGVNEDSWSVIGTINPAGNPRSRRPMEFRPEGNSWIARLPGLAPGLYQVEVRTTLEYPIGPPPVSDVFEVR